MPRTHAAVLVAGAMAGLLWPSMPSMAAASPSPVASAPTGAQRPAVVGFLPYWLLDDALPAMDLERLTTLAWFGVEANGAGELVKRKPSGIVPGGWAGLDDPRVLDLQVRARSAGTRFVVTIQRFGWTSGAARRTRALLTDPGARATLAGRIARLVEERGLDGVNLDVEPVPLDLADEYVLLVRDVRAAIDEVGPGLELSVDVTSSLAGYDLAGLTGPGAADAAIIMGYDYRGAGSAIAAATAPLVSRSGPDLEETMAAALATVPGERLLLALPWYGRDWPTDDGQAGARTLPGPGGPLPAGVPASAVVGYADAVARAQLDGRRYQPDQASAWTSAPEACVSCPGVWRQTWYDDPDSFGTKVEAARAAGLRGVGIWALGHERGRPELWSALRYRLDGIADTTPPVGAVTLVPESVRGTQDSLPIVEGTAELRLAAADEVDGSGLGYVRVSLAPDTRPDGALGVGRTFPATDTIGIAVGDPALGAHEGSGATAIHVQWRDLAGNWSAPVVIEAWASPGVP